MQNNFEEGNFEMPLILFMIVTITTSNVTYI